VPLARHDFNIRCCLRGCRQMAASAKNIKNTEKENKPTQTLS
jgi:hypothetical protein